MYKILDILLLLMVICAIIIALGVSLEYKYFVLYYIIQTTMKGLIIMIDAKTVFSNRIMRLDRKAYLQIITGRLYYA